MTNPEAIDASVLAQLQELGTANISGRLGALGLRSCHMQGVSPINSNRAKFCGEAVTVRYIPAREDLDARPQTPEEIRTNPQWRMADTIEAGKVLVIDSRGDARGGVVGGVIASRLAFRGAAAIVTDGGLRDSEELAQLPIAAHAGAAVAPPRAWFSHVADCQVPIGCGGVAVYPGDILVGDADGVIVIPRHLARDIAKAGTQHAAMEEYVAGLIRGGEPLIGNYPPGPAAAAAVAAMTDKN